VRLSLRSLGRAFGALGTLLLGGVFVLESHYAETSPRMAEPQSGHVYPLNAHGVVFVTSKEQVQLHILEVGAAICMVCFAFAVYFEIRRTRKVE
jgi:hypothetical protein